MCSIRVSVSGAAQSNELAPTADETQLSHGVPKSPRRGATVESDQAAGREESLAGGGLLSFLLRQLLSSAAIAVFKCKQNKMYQKSGRIAGGGRATGQTGPQGDGPMPVGCLMTNLQPLGPILFLFTHTNREEAAKWKWKKLSHLGSSKKNGIGKLLAIEL